MTQGKSLYQNVTQFLSVIPEGHDNPSVLKHLRVLRVKDTLRVRFVFLFAVVGGEFFGTLKTATNLATTGEWCVNRLNISMPQFTPPPMVTQDLPTLHNRLKLYPFSPHCDPRKIRTKASVQEENSKWGFKTMGLIRNLLKCLILLPFLDHPPLPTSRQSLKRSFSSSPYGNVEHFKGRKRTL